MKKIFLYGAVGVLLVGAVGVLALDNFNKSENLPAASAESYKDATYLVDGTNVTLVNGKAETEIAPGSASKLVTQYFGNEVTTDLNGDGRSDVVFLLTQSGGGSGTFFYVVGALNTDNGYVGSDAVLLGDRIAPQTTEVSQNPAQKGVVVVNYMDRAPGDSMTTPPSIGKSLYLKLDPATMQFGIVEPNFEGEADAATMSLNMKTWNWVGATYSNDTSLTLKKPKSFTLTFLPGNHFSATTDCNGIAGSYMTKDATITFSEIASTLMYCEGSQEADFSKLFDQIIAYHFTGKGELVFDLKLDSGSVVFK